MSRYRRTRFIAVITLMLGALAALAPAASAVPDAPAFGPWIEGYAPYVGQSECKPRPKPGVVAFRDRVLEAYPATRPGSISRACDVGGRSEHKEGRAWDWGVSASVASERTTAREVRDWLMATDGRGNADAMARRLGIMYFIWNRHWWTSWDPTWHVYCRDRNGRCITPSGSVAHPHDDHMHVSFGWRGARMKTSFWIPELSRQ